MTAEITEADLRTRVHIFADDSMLGRDAPGLGDAKAAHYLAAELQRMGLEPAGENGTYFQDLPYYERGMVSGGTLSIRGAPLKPGEDFIPSSRVVPRPLDGAPSIYGGVLGNDTRRQITAEQARGKLVILTVPEASSLPVPIPRNAPTRFAGAAGIAVVNLHLIPPGQRESIVAPQHLFAPMGPPDPPPGPVVLLITPDAATRILGASPDSVALGRAGGVVHGRLELAQHRSPNVARNVIALLRGRDPVLRNQYVAIGAHKDHDGVNRAPVDHDSARVVAYLRNQAAIAGSRTTGRSVRAMLDSIRRERAPRLDSIFNGADDDASGSMAVLEIAEALAAAPAPRRSVLFVWHTGEEDGLLGSRWFTDNPTVQRDSIVAQVNIDMIGRGGATDIPGGGPDYLIAVGHRRTSRALAGIVDSVNAAQRPPFRIDLSWDSPDHPEQIFGRSDHANYARFGIPIVFFFTGLHHDYHQVTDEPQYLDYPHYTRIVRYIRDVVVTVANREGRLK